MTCMKCGAQIGEDRVFCDHCLNGMEDYPVNPETHIHLPKRALIAETPKKPTKKKRTPSLEEQLAATKLKVLRLRLAAVVLAFLLVVTAGLFLLHMQRDAADSMLGKNYHIDTSMND